MIPYAHDYADARPTQPELAVGGSAGSCRYVKRLLPNDYDLGGNERAQLLAWGQAVLYNAEQNAGDLVEQGATYFRDYGAYVHDRLLGWGVDPAGVNVALSADREVSDKQLPGVIGNYDAFAQTVAAFCVVAYAQYSVINLLVIERISPAGAKHWLPGAIGWSGFDNTPDGWNAYISDPRVGLVQLGPQAVGWWNGHSFAYGAPGAPVVAGTDVNLALDMAAVGFDFPPGHPYAPKRKAPDMPLFHVKDSAGNGYYTDGLVRRRLVSSEAEKGINGDGNGGATLAIHDGHVIDGTLYFTPDQVEAMPDSGPAPAVTPPPTPAPDPTPPAPTAGLTIDQIAAQLELCVKGASA